MTAVARNRREAAGARNRHPTARRLPDGRGPQAQTLRSSALYRLLLAAALGLSLLGVVMVLSASSANAIDGGDPWAPFLRQLMWLGVGIVAMGITSRIHYRIWADRLSRVVLIVAIAMLVIVLIPGVGLNINGSQRWFGYGSVTFQPSEFAKFAMIIWSADLLSRHQRRLDNPHDTIYPLVMTMAVVGVLLLLEPDLGTSILIGTLVLLLMFVAGASLKHIGLVAGVGFLLAGGLAMMADYRRERLLAFRNPWADPLEATFQTVQSGVAVANGGVQGVGLGASRAKWGYLPYTHSDFVFALVAEELGFVGGIAVLAAFVLLAVFGFAVGYEMRDVDPFASLLAIGITAWILLQSFINIGAAVGALPITGVTLPFVSAGGSSLVIMLAAYGVLLNVARHSR